MFWKCGSHLLVLWILMGIMAGFLEVPLINRKKCSTWFRIEAVVAWVRVRRLLTEK